MSHQSKVPAIMCAYCNISKKIDIEAERMTDNFIFDLNGVRIIARAKNNEYAHKKSQAQFLIIDIKMLFSFMYVKFKDKYSSKKILIYVVLWKKIYINKPIVNGKQTLRQENNFLFIVTPQYHHTAICSKSQYCNLL